MCYSLWYNAPPTILPATSWGVHYTTSCNTKSSAPEDRRDQRSKHVELIGIINKPLLLHLVGVYIIYVNDVGQTNVTVPTSCFCAQYRNNCKYSKFHFPLLSDTYHTARDDIKFYCVFKQREPETQFSLSNEVGPSNLFVCTFQEPYTPYSFGQAIIPTSHATYDRERVTWG